MRVVTVRVCVVEDKLFRWDECSRVVDRVRHGAAQRLGGPTSINRSG